MVFYKKVEVERISMNSGLSADLYSFVVEKDHFARFHRPKWLPSHQLAETNLSSSLTISHTLLHRFFRTETLSIKNEPCDLSVLRPEHEEIIEQAF